MFQIGDTAPDFELLNDEGQLTKLSDLRGRRVVLFFYPKADTPGCTTQACGLRDNFPVFQENNAIVLGVSPDSVADLAKWRTKQNLPYNLLSDLEHTVAEAYGVWGEKSMYGKTYFGITRSHFVIGVDGTFEDVQFKVSPQDSIDRAVKVAAG